VFIFAVVATPLGEKMRRLLIPMLIITSLMLLAIPLVSAVDEIDSMGIPHRIKIIPVGGVETGDPIVTTSPADLMIFHTGNGPINDVWLLIVLNKPTYDALDKITVNGTTFMTKSDFKLVTTSKIPPTQANSALGYPGSLCQYEVSAVKDKMDEKGNPIYYGMKFFLAKITKASTKFTLTVELSSSVKLKALVLGLGRYESGLFTSSVGIDCNTYRPFNTCNSFSKSTLVVPEIATLALTSAPFAGAIGFYINKRRKK
jgi:hypothetical protein